MGYPDKTLVCVECGDKFIWTAGEQEYFAERGFTEPPKRCRDCRQARRGRGGDAVRKGGKK